MGDWTVIRDPAIRRFSAQTFGVLGLGRIGTAAGLRAKALGFNVMFYDPHRPNGTELSFGFARAKSLEQLLQHANILSVHVPLTAETTGMLGAAQFAMMPEGTRPTALPEGAQAFAAHAHGPHAAVQQRAPVHGPRNPQGVRRTDPRRFRYRSDGRESENRHHHRHLPPGRRPDLFLVVQRIAQSLSNIEEVNVLGGTLDATSGEETLDVEWSSSIAPGAKVRVYASGDLEFQDIDACLSQLVDDVLGVLPPTPRPPGPGSPHPAPRSMRFR